MQEIVYSVPVVSPVLKPNQEQVDSSAVPDTFEPMGSNRALSGLVPAVTGPSVISSAPLASMTFPAVLYALLLLFIFFTIKE